MPVSSLPLGLQGTWCWACGVWATLQEDSRGAASGEGAAKPPSLVGACIIAVCELLYHCTAAAGRVRDGKGHKCCESCSTCLPCCCCAC